MLTRRPYRSRLALGLVGAVVVAGTAVLPAGPAYAAVACEVVYQKAWDNGSGFGANFAIRNLGDPLNGWTLRYAWAGNQRVTQGWGGIWSQPAGSNQVTVVNESWNGSVATGATITGPPGFNGEYSGTNTNPTSFTINNVACTGANPPPTVSITSPAAGQHFPAGSNVTVNATAADTAPGTVTQVDFFRNGMLVGTDTTSPYSFVHSGLPAGSYTLQARATDNGGATATAEVAIVVDPATGPTLVVDPTAVSVTAGATATFGVRLSAAPASNVTVGSTRTSGSTCVTISAGGSLTFTPANALTPQNVTVAAAAGCTGSATIAVSATGFSTVNVTATVIPANQNPYVTEFLTQYNKIKNSGYFSPEGVPYHAIETLLVEAPDHGHETTSEAFSFWLWLEAQFGRVSGDWAPFNTAWNTMETFIIPTAAGQPGGSASYNPADPADYASEHPQPSGYPTALDSGVIAGQDPLAGELQSTYGNRLMYGMHWLLDVDNVYGYGTGNTAGTDCGDSTARVEYINTYQRGAQESVWETVAHPSCAATGHTYNGVPQANYPSLFIGGSGNGQWRYTDAPDADARAVQAAYWALTWATAQGKQSQISATVAKAAKMGDFLRYSFYDKYFKNPGCASTSCTPGTGKSSSSFMLTWYYAWGGDIGGAWAWRIGSSAWHQGYQNPLAAFALSPAGPAALRPLSPSAAADWQTSLSRQLDSYLWLQSAEGGIAGGATNSVGGAYGPRDPNLPNFFGWQYDFQPVFHDPPSNQWFGFQAWSLERVAEYYFVTGDAKAKTILDRWVPWALSHTTFGPATGAFQIPSDMTWSGAPAGSYTTSTAAGPPANPGLHVTIANSSSDVGVAAAYARTLAYYAAKSGSTTAKAGAKSLIDAILAHKDSKGAAVCETRTDYNRFDDPNNDATNTGLFIPPGFTGTMPNGNVIQNGKTFLDIRSFYQTDTTPTCTGASGSGWAAIQAYMANTGPAPGFTYHRFWAQADIAMAAADFGALFPNG
ncbi:MAG TPA: glycoside hydrolase family 48 protein [Micromonosporaceae bacterium]|jgi:hypothetical protein|nr:glycoside hydrolase family 48 protein [Micromonosporaceae bacterium]